MLYAQFLYGIFDEPCAACLKVCISLTNAVDGFFITFPLPFQSGRQNVIQRRRGI